VFAAVLHDLNKFQSRIILSQHINKKSAVAENATLSCAMEVPPATC